MAKTRASGHSRRSLGVKKFASSLTGGVTMGTTGAAVPRPAGAGTAQTKSPLAKGMPTRSAPIRSTPGRKVSGNPGKLNGVNTSGGKNVGS